MTNDRIRELLAAMTAAAEGPILLRQYLDGLDATEVENIAFMASTMAVLYLRALAPGQDITDSLRRVALERLAQ